ncbi:haloacid dehalogenase-like hydrolase domain-containing protein At2g33255 [Aristolochia californica]|uniref:haloacid dehalogenase-like hydrolase domain-containing protein At2g33255 n=1 Tax=Aristolochia californica TaxID=171875 RepID=UPI0035E3B928
MGGCMLWLYELHGAVELCKFLDSRKIRRGLITRNIKAAVDLFHQRFGVARGKRAGAFTCLLDETGRYNSSDFLAADLQPDFKVSSLVEVNALLEENFELSPLYNNF